MSEKINDGGPAFPHSLVADVYDAKDASPGMSLRDWFAGLAMQASIVSLGLHYHKSEDEIRECKEHSVRLAYITADAMIAERAAAKGDQP